MSKQEKGRRWYYFHGCKAKKKGKKNEDKFYDAFYTDNFQKPKWFKEIRKGTPEEDGRGIDFVAETYTRHRLIFIQIKSSDWGKRNFWRKYSPREFQYPIVVIVIGNKKYHQRNINIRKNFFESVRRVLRHF